MRRILPGDVVAVARLLLKEPQENRISRCRRVISETEAAHRYFKRFGKSHTEWGNGSLIASVLRFDLPPEPSFSNAD